MRAGHAADYAFSISALVGVSVPDFVVAGLLIASFALAILIVISHDLGMVTQLADYILVLRNGEAVERGSVSATLTEPQHHYTRELVAAHERPGQRL